VHNLASKDGTDSSANYSAWEIASWRRGRESILEAPPGREPVKHCESAANQECIRFEALRARDTHEN